MTVSLSAWSTRSILLDIEGTTTPIDFVYRVLFPFARDRVERYLTEHIDHPALASDVGYLQREHASDEADGLAPPAWVDAPGDARVSAVSTYVRWLMDRDRKTTGLKSLQGRIWEQGYARGALAGQVFPDVMPALQRWTRAGLFVNIFSSGSVLAQQLLFRSCPEGDLTQWVNRHFDTTTGSKKEPASYRRIADEVGASPERILFISDVTAELDAAAAAGVRTVLAVRPGNAPAPLDTPHAVVRSFDDICT